MHTHLPQVTEYDIHFPLPHCFELPRIAKFEKLQGCLIEIRAHLQMNFTNFDPFQSTLNFCCCQLEYKPQGVSQLSH